MEADKSPQQWRPIIPYKLRCENGCEEEELEEEAEEELEEEEAEEELEGTKRDSSSSERISFEMLYVII